MQNGRFEYKPLAKYPHLKPEDILTWIYFMAKYPTEYERVDYDFALGELPDHIAAAEKLNIAGAEKLYQYKTDVIGYTQNRVDIIELKGKATLATIGQVLGYQNLYDREFGDGRKTRAVIIAREESPDLVRIALENDVVLILV